MQERGYHDIGGDVRAAGPVIRDSGPVPRWALLVEALRKTPGLRYCLHEQRRKVEELGPHAFEEAGYYGIRVLAMKEMLVEKGLLSAAQVAERMTRIASRKARDD